MKKNIFDNIIENLNSKKIAIYDKKIVKYSEINIKFLFYNNFLKKKIIKSSCIAIKLNFGIDYIALILSSYYNKNKILLLDPKSKDKEDKFKINDTSSTILFTEVSKKRNTELDAIYYEEIIHKRKEKYNKNDFVIIYTSGSTKKKKGVLLSAENISSNVKSIINDLKLNSSHTSIIFSNPSYAMGISQILTFLFLKAPMAISKHGLLFSNQILEVIYNYKIKLININSSMAKIFDLYDKKKEPFNFVKIIMHGGMPLKKDAYKYFKKKFPNAKIVNFYGCTENSPRISQFIVNKFEKKITVGKPLKGIKIKLIPIIGNKKNEMQWELAISGPSLTRGYLNLDKLNQEKFIDGFFLTGDIVEINNNSQIFLIGRKDNVFRVGHEKIEPEEIENQLNNINGIDESCVIKIKDNILNWVPIFIIKRSNINLTKKEIFNKFNKLFSSYKHPRSIYFVKKINKTNYGKIDRKIIEKKYINRIKIK